MHTSEKLKWQVDARPTHNAETEFHSASFKPVHLRRKMPSRPPTVEGCHGDGDGDGDDNHGAALLAADLRLWVDSPGGEAHHPAGGRRVGAVRAQDLRVLLDVADSLHPLLRGGHTAHLPHAVHLVAHDLAPIRAVLVRLNDREVVVAVVVQDQRRAAPLIVDDGHAAVHELVAGDDHAEGRQRRGIVLDDHAVVHTQDRAVFHVPPTDLVGVGKVDVVGVVESAVRVHDVAGVVFLRHVGLEPLVVIEVLVLVGVDHGRARPGGVAHEVRVGIHLALVGEGDGRVQAHLAALRVVHGADLEALGVAAQQPGVSAAVARGAGGHAACLREDARAAVVAAREGDGVLVVVREVEVAGEPPLDARVAANGVDEPFGIDGVAVVQPTAAVDNVALLEDAERRANDRGVREAEDLPTFLIRMLLDDLLEPLQLLLIDGDLVRGVLRRAECSRAQAHDQDLLGDHVSELWRLLAQVVQVGLEILLIRAELVDALQVVISAHNVKLRTEAIQELARHLEALGGAREELLGLVAILGLAQVSQGDNKRAH
mmetsp:Transcript_104045/g.279485  ORF Transcript_104045/g.279485 Transcript_104045/m.279485 type:complete len:543 (+) Transcript_104045:119-1747(+)